MRVRTPEILLPPVWPLPRSLATTCGISVDVFSSPYLDVSVQAVPYMNLWIQFMLIRYCRTGFPHSDISGSMLICSSPKLFAAYHVLHRLLMPRHSPCALISLTCRRIGSILFAAGSLEPPSHAFRNAPPQFMAGHELVYGGCGFGAMQLFKLIENSPKL